MIDAMNPSFTEAAATRSAVLRKPAQTRPTRRPASAKPARIASTGLARASGPNCLIRQRPLARKIFQTLLEVIDPLSDAGYGQKHLCDAVYSVERNQPGRVSVCQEPAFVDEEQVIADALGKGEVLGCEQ